MHVTKFSLDSLLSYAKAAVFTAAVGGLCSGAFAQGVFEGSGEEENSSCVGDGCGIEIPTPQEPAPEQDMEASLAADTSAVTTTDTLIQASTPTDSVQKQAGEVDINDEDDSRPNFINESRSDYQARKEGFSRSIQFGFRIGGGINLPLGPDSDGWSLSYAGTAGFNAALPIFRFVAIQSGLDFTYRCFFYEGDTDYGHNEAQINQMLFEIPVIIRYTMVEDAFFIGLGGNLGLKMSGDSEFKQTIDTEKRHAKDKRSNTLPTAGVDIGGLVSMGFMVGRHVMVDFRFVQNLSNLLNLDVIAESSLMGTKLYTFHSTLGISLLL